MAIYEKCQQTRQTILLLAKKLFWEKGYKNTRYGDFQELADINPGTLHYYFKNKESLGWEVYHEFEIESRQIVDEILKEANVKDALMVCIINTLLCWEWIDASKEFQRFVYEAALSRIPIKSLEEWDYYGFGMLNNFFDLHLSQREINFYNKISASIENELILLFYSGFEVISAQECATYDILYAYKNLDIPEKVIREKMEEAEVLIAPYRFQVKPYFKSIYEKS